jgi:hypothetical protein
LVDERDNKETLGYEEIRKRYGRNIQPDGNSLLQVNATIFVGVLIFLTVSSISNTENQSQIRLERLYISIITAGVLIPFSLSASLLLVAIFGWHADDEKRKSYIVYASKSTLVGFLYIPMFVILVGLVIMEAPWFVAVVSGVGILASVLVYVLHFKGEYSRKETKENDQRSRDPMRLINKRH